MQLLPHIRLSLLLVLSFLYTVSQATEVEGRWITIDDRDGSRKSIVTLNINETGELSGTITELLREAAKGSLCDKCPDDFKNKPLEGLTFMWGLTREATGEWTGGHILDPKSGKIYKAKLELNESGNSLSVRGFIGFSLFGRSQEWQRYTP
ncbi:DUF2147 domain-containing protein [Gilvimarinus polysaccharolyticus]|uniref:DUF2147 domain-containing protein n=1 Tax=Gilvimarinus polysaccharolyticus TaxID=863921 RepID=UPI000673356A|nr:DUF2147 domain-containing protein [Gilvimarinus polysaccharolyticus]